MDNYVARANIDHFLELLHDQSIAVEDKSAINKLLIAEEDKLSHDLEQVEFAESRAAKCRERIVRLQSLRDDFIDGSADQILADRLLENFQLTLDLVDGFCHHMRNEMARRSI
ncbi:MAG TPA: hypothetical protein VHB49_11760 [Bradyrhizobium sp.]|nr:hypothetical protein [Bradyrhizobium sp.]